MRMRAIPKPSVLVAGALEDSGRFLFIKRRTDEREEFELPCAIIPQGSDPVRALAEIFLSQLGIDAQVHGVIREARHNAGSRKKKRWIPTLLFKITAKNAFAKPAPGLGFAWLSLDDARKKRFSRNAEWLKY